MTGKWMMLVFAAINIAAGFWPGGEDIGYAVLFKVFAACGSCYIAGMCERWRLAWSSR